ncbi:YSIRK-type signal peptide-containing protein [Aerococcus urinaeequi]|uniref:YSIRK-type signal peptide-containing protein n=1 Tax=Aerococcus urinaeequi TaxID=51665 RepID=UPI003AAFF55B
MIGKNNHFVKRKKKNGERFQRYAIKRLSIGFVSAAVATGFFLGSVDVALADELANTSSQTELASANSESESESSELDIATEELDQA